MNFDLLNPVFVKSEWLIGTGLLYIFLYLIFIDNFSKLFTDKSKSSKVYSFLSGLLLVVLGFLIPYTPLLFHNSIQFYNISTFDIAWYYYISPIIITMLAISFFYVKNNFKSKYNNMLIFLIIVIWLLTLLFNSIY